LFLWHFLRFLLVLYLTLIIIKKKHFITKSNLDAQSIIDQVSKEVSLSLPKRKLTCLIIESGWVKKVEKALA